MKGHLPAYKETMLSSLNECCKGKCISMASEWSWYAEGDSAQCLRAEDSRAGTFRVEVGGESAAGLMSGSSLYSQTSRWIVLAVPNLSALWLFWMYWLEDWLQRYPDVFAQDGLFFRGLACLPRVLYSDERHLGHRDL